MSRWKKDSSQLKPGSLEMRGWLTTKTGKEYKKRQNEYAKKWRKKNRTKFLATQKRCYDKIRLEALEHYSEGKVECACCGEKGLVFLSIDHIKGNGSEERRKIDPKGKRGGNGFVYWLKKNGWPKGYQILCYNCNFAKRQNTQCPHQLGTVEEFITQKPKQYNA